MTSVRHCDRCLAIGLPRGARLILVAATGQWLYRECVAARDAVPTQGRVCSGHADCRQDGDLADGHVRTQYVVEIPSQAL